MAPDLRRVSGLLLAIDSNEWRVDAISLRSFAKHIDREEAAWESSAKIGLCAPMVHSGMKSSIWPLFFFPFLTIPVILLQKTITTTPKIMILSASDNPGTDNAQPNANSSPSLKSMRSPKATAC